MRMIINGLGIIGFIVIIAALVFVLYGRENTWTAIAGPADLGDQDLLSITRVEKPNDALFCSQGLCEGVRVDKVLPNIEMSPAALIAALDEAARKHSPRIQRVDDGSEPTRARYITRSNLMRYPDTAWLQTVKMPDGSAGIIAYSRSQLGYSDLGANKARLEMWLSHISAD